MIGKFDVGCVFRLGLCKLPFTHLWCTRPLEVLHVCGVVFCSVHRHCVAYVWEVWCVPMCLSCSMVGLCLGLGESKLCFKQVLYIFPLMLFGLCGV